MVCFLAHTCTLTKYSGNCGQSSHFKNKKNCRNCYYRSKVQENTELKTLKPGNTLQCKQLFRVNSYT